MVSIDNDRFSDSFETRIGFMDYSISIDTADPIDPDFCLVVKFQPLAYYLFTLN